MPNGVIKRYVEICYKGKKIFTGKCIEGDSTSYIDSCTESCKNLKTLIDGYEGEITRLDKKITILQEEIKAIKGEE